MNLRIILPETRKRRISVEVLQIKCHNSDDVDDVEVDYGDDYDYGFRQ